MQALRRHRHPGRPCHQGRQIAGRAWSSTWWTRCCHSRRRRASLSHPARREEPVRPTDEIGVFEMTGGGLQEVANPSALFLSSVTSGRRARGVRRIEGTRPLLSRCRHWWPRRRSARRAAPWWGGTRTASPWCWPCWRPIAACGSLATTSISTSPAACASRNRPRTLRQQPRWSPRSPTRRCRRMRSISARYRSPAWSGRWRRPPPASRRRQARLRPRLRAGHGAQRGRRCRDGAHVGRPLMDIVGEIAPKGTRRRQAAQEETNRPRCEQARRYNAACRKVFPSPAQEG